MAAIVALVDDLLFLSRIREAARGRRLEVQAARTGADAVAAARPVVGFFSHVEAQRGRDAAQAGCTTVLPRSAFVQKLDALLAEAAAVSGGGGEPGA